MPADELLAHLRALEVFLHQPAAAADAARVGAILHADFTEFGSSGATYSRAQIMAALAENPCESPRRIWSQDYRLLLQTDDTALLLYHTAHIGYAGQLVHHTLRSTLWRHGPAGWQMLFHQGTPTLPFEAAARNESAAA